MNSPDEKLIQVASTIFRKIKTSKVNFTADHFVKLAESNKISKEIIEYTDSWMFSTTILFLWEIRNEVDKTDSENCIAVTDAICKATEFSGCNETILTIVRFIPKTLFQKLCASPEKLRTFLISLSKINYTYVFEQLAHNSKLVQKGINIVGEMNETLFVTLFTNIIKYGSKLVAHLDMDTYGLTQCDFDNYKKIINSSVNMSEILMLSQNLTLLNICKIIKQLRPLIITIPGNLYRQIGQIFLQMGHLGVSVQEKYLNILNILSDQDLKDPIQAVIESDQLCNLISMDYIVDNQINFINSSVDLSSLAKIFPLNIVKKVVQQDMPLIKYIPSSLIKVIIDRIDRDDMNKYIDLFIKGKSAGTFDIAGKIALSIFSWPFNVLRCTLKSLLDKSVVC